MALPPAIPLCTEPGCKRIEGHRGKHSNTPREAWAFLNPKDRLKLSKAGYATPRGGKKGAYQNHVNRNNRVIVPYEKYNQVDLKLYLDGYVVRLLPEQAFNRAGELKPQFSGNEATIKIGENAFVLYRSHESYANYPPLATWKVRTLELEDGTIVKERVKGVLDKGHYVLRLPKANGNDAVVDGEAQGIFAPEYATEEQNFLSKCLLAWITIHTDGSRYTTEMAGHLRAILKSEDIISNERLERKGIIVGGRARCPLCNQVIKYSELHETISFKEVAGLANAGIQIVGATRSTAANLFHIIPLVYTALEHKPENLAWGHAICNTKLGQRQCYSLDELIEMNLKLGIITSEGLHTFGWISEDRELIRGSSGAVWIRIVDDTGHLEVEEIEPEEMDADGEEPTESDGE